MKQPVIVSACRTAIGNFNGTLRSVPATRLGALVISEVIRRAGLQPEAVDEVIMGCVLPHGMGQNPARQACLQGGLPLDLECLTINKVCGSGLKAVMLAAQAVACGDAELVVAGGMENMNRCPYLLPKARQGYRMGSAELVDGMVHDGLWDVNNDFHMGYTAELIADKFGIGREEMDAFALSSYRKALAAQQQGRFDDEIVTVTVDRGRKLPPLEFNRDEVPRETTLEALAQLRPAFKPDGRVTAGNSSKISDGAAAVLVTSEERARELGLAVIARIGAQGAAAQDPKDVLVTPILSIPKVLKKAGLDIADIDLHEVNEAFAVSTVAVMKELGIPEQRLNVHGGAVALGHPIGASGARVLVTLLYALQQQDLKRGMASLCLGGGGAVSLIVERP
ncbi:MAG: acetyl-CoA C-acyltransferase [Deltaproteobacteria bacterium]|nr:MAG: acetyl-CoA C-acyltransferase [Deltaproteobacteria bacterium]